MNTKYYIVNNASRASQYGIGTYVRQLSLALRNIANVVPVYIDLYADVEEFEMTKDDDGYVHYLFPEYPSTIESDAYCRNTAYIMSEYIEKDSCNIFHFNYFQHYSLALLLKASYPNSCIIFVVHYLEWCFELNGNISKFRKTIVDDNADKEARQIKREFEQNKVFLHLADSVVVLSKFCLELMKNDYGISEKRLHLVYNGLESADKDCWSPAGKSSRTILYVGRLDKIKGIDYLIKAFSIVLSKHDDVRLIVVGDGDYNEYLKLCEGFWHKVTFTGKIPQSTLAELYKEATIGILPSFHEQCSYSAIEFMRQGIPFIGTDSTGLGEMLDGMNDARVHIDEENFSEEAFINELADKICRLLDSRERRAALSEALKKRFAERHSIERMSEGISRLLAMEEDADAPAVSEEFLPHIDSGMMLFVNMRPDIDTDFYGMSGIGVYLWWRICSLNKPEDEAYSYCLQEYMIYYLDWMYEVLMAEGVEAACEEIKCSLLSMKKVSFYRTRVCAILDLLNISSCNTEELPDADVDSIIANAMKMITTKV